MNKLNSEKIINLFFLTSCLCVAIIYFAGDLFWRSTVVSTGVFPPTPFKPYAGFMRVPGAIVRLVPESQGPMGADFSQVYFAAQALQHGESGYSAITAAYKDPFGRISSYPPFAHWLYIPVTIFPYWVAVLIQDFGQLLLFFVLAGIVMRKMGVWRHWWKVYGFYIIFYFYTPAGWTHFERGQFDLFSASVALLLFMTVYSRDNKPLSLIAAGFFSAIKYVSLPFLGSFSFLSFLAAKGRTRWFYLLPLGVLAVSLLAFWPQTVEYIGVLRFYDVTSGREGVTFMHMMPPFLAKTFQIGCMLVFGAIFWWMSNEKSRQKLFEIVSLPFALAMAVQGLCFGTMSFEYRVVMMFGLIPGFILWMETARAPVWIKAALASTLLVFLVVAFHTFDNYVNMYPAYMTAGYLLVSMFWLGLCVYLVILNKPKLKAG